MKSVILILAFLTTLDRDCAAQINYTNAYGINNYSNGFDINIKVFRDTFDFTEAIVIRMDITNITEIDQKIIIDTLTGRPSGCTSIALIDRKTKRSVISYANREILSSKLLEPGELKRKTFYLTPKDFVRHWFTLTDIAILKTSDNILTPGNYELQVSYCGKKSNKVFFSVK